MSIRHVTMIGHRALEQRTKKVKEVTDEIRTLVADMIETNRAADGAGLAAPQVGSRWRLFVYDCTDADDVHHEGHVLNPVLERFGPLELDEEWLEGCLSVPGEGFPTARFRGARVHGTDLDGGDVLLEDEGGVLSRALQHEVDHLDGHLYLDRLSPALRREARDAVTARGWREHGQLSWDPSRLRQEEV